MTTPSDILERLDGHASDLGTLSDDLNEVQEQLRPLQEQVDAHLRAHEVGLWQKHVNNGDKFPPEKVRERLAIQDLDPVLYGRHTALLSKRKQLQQRISDLKAEIDAERSILSALKEEMAATR